MLSRGPKRQELSHSKKKFKRNKPVFVKKAPLRSKPRGSLTELKMTDGQKSWSGKKVFSCKKCGEDFKYKSGLSKHLRIHADEKEFLRRELSTKLNLHGSSTDHFQIHCGGATLICITCGKQFYSEFELSKHLATHPSWARGWAAGENYVACGTCAEQFSHMQKLTRHLLLHFREAQAYLKPHSWKSVSDLNLAVTADSAGNTYKNCVTCGETFDCVSKLNDHLIAHVNKIPTGREVSDKVQKSQSKLITTSDALNLIGGSDKVDNKIANRSSYSNCKEKSNEQFARRQPLTSHSDDRSIVNKTSNETFVSRFDRTVHSEAHDSRIATFSDDKIHSEERTVVQGAPDKTLISNYLDISSHTSQNAAAIGFPCNISDQNLVSEHPLLERSNRHPYKSRISYGVPDNSVMNISNQNVSSDLQNIPATAFTGDTCSETFHHDLNKLTGIHSNKRYFVHEIANEIQTNNCDLSIKHERQNGKQNTFSVDICNETSSSNHSLIEHLRIQSQDRTVTYNLQNEVQMNGFNQNAHLNSQNATGNTFSCDVRTKTFFSKQILKEHVRSHSIESNQARSDPTENNPGRSHFNESRHMKSHSNGISRDHKTSDETFVNVPKPANTMNKTSPVEDPNLPNAITILTKPIGTTNTTSPTVDHNPQNALTMTFACNLCRKEFNYWFLLNDHLHSHFSKTPFTCEVCGDSFNHTFDLMLHRVVHSAKVNSLSCNKCGTTFSCQSSLNEHLKTVCSALSIVCGICKERFKSNYDLMTHRLVHFGILKLRSKSQTVETQLKVFTVFREKRGKASENNSNLSEYCENERECVEKETLSCTKCSEVFSCQSDFNEHLEVHSTETSLTNETYPETLKSTSHCTEHQLAHVEKKISLSCHTCSKTFTCQSDLNEHMPTHSTETAVTCETCQETFTSKSDLAEHQLAHANGTVTFSCNKCSETFSHRSKLLAHVHSKAHSKMFPSMCTACGKKILSAADYFSYHSSLTGKTAKLCKKCTNRSKLSCKFCDESFVLKSELREHLDLYHGDFKCKTCGENFKEQASFQVHLKGHINEKPFSCEFCEKTCSDKVALSAHKRQVHGLGIRNKIPCEFCEETFKKLVYLHNHAEKHHADKLPFVCGKCHKKFLSVSRLRNHPPCYFKVKRFSCETCGNLFVSRSLLARHLLGHTRASLKKTFSCKFCGERFSKTKLKEHFLLSHSDQLSFPCDTCGKRFMTQQSLNTHYHTHEDTSFSCKTCKKTLNSQASLTNHLRSHAEIKDQFVSCDFCEAKFGFVFQLQEHFKKSHADLFPYACDICDKGFKDKKSRNRHRAAHMDPPKSVSCNTCGKLCTSEGNLRKHLKSHENDRLKLFTCDVCGKQCTARGHLKQHMKSHSNDRQFSCDICGKSWWSEGHLTSHLRTHAKDSGFSCETCGKKYTQKHSLKKHLLSHTKKKSSSCKVRTKAIHLRRSLRARIDLKSSTEI